MICDASLFKSILFLLVAASTSSQAVPSAKARKARAHSEGVAGPLASRLWPRSGPDSPSTLVDEQGQRPLWYTSRAHTRHLFRSRLIDVVSKLLLLHGLRSLQQEFNDGRQPRHALVIVSGTTLCPAPPFEALRLPPDFGLANSSPTRLTLYLLDLLHLDLITSIACRIPRINVHYNIILSNSVEFH